MTHVVVVGGGIAGLTAAFELSGVGATPKDGSVNVTVLDAQAFGGMLRSAPVDGQLVDVGPDGFLARRPEAAELIRELGASAQLEPVGASGAWVVVHGTLHPLPSGFTFGVPTRFADLRSRDARGVLGLRGVVRASLDLVAPRPARRSALEDRAIGPLVADKLGVRVVERLVDPLVGGIHAGRVADLSAAAVFPQLGTAAQQRGSLMRALRAPQTDRTGPAGPTFLTVRNGLGTLPELLVGALQARGVGCVPNVRVTGIDRDPIGRARWTISTTGGTYDADAVVLATPAADTAELLSSLDPTATSLLARIDAASVATITVRVDDASVVLPESGTGVLVPAGERFGKEPRLVTAITFLDRKWPHLRSEGTTLLRASVGRIDDVRFESLDDATLVDRVLDELGRLLGLNQPPRSSLVVRWPNAFPQYRVNHLARVDAIEASVRALGGIAVCGAAYRGVGIPACIASGRAAARATRSWLATHS